MLAHASPLDAQVVDWNNRVIGRIDDADRDPRTHSLRALLVQPEGEARARLGEGRIVIPMRLVFGMRRGEVILDRSIDEVVKLDASQRRGVTCEPPVHGSGP
jgi:sporulation protein YlmC with PRC-barrel domain